MSHMQPNCCLKIDSQKVDQHAGGKWLIHNKSRKDNQDISCKAWNSPAEYPSWEARCDIKGSDCILLNTIFWRKVQGQKHPRWWGIVEHQIPSNKVLFKTNNKSHKHPGFKLFSSEGKTQLVHQRKNKKWHSTQELRTPQKYSPIECDGVQLHQYWMTLLLFVYIRPITELI